MMVHFEKVKKVFKADGKARISIPIRYEMQGILEEIYGKRIKEILKDKTDKGIAFVSGNMVIQHKQALELFEPVIRYIVNHLRELLLKPNLRDINYIFLVGGFSECTILQEEIKKAFDDGTTTLKVLTPSSAQLAVVKGAVLYGHQPHEIKTRRARFTYGSAVSVPFDPLIHDRMYKRISALGVARCDDIFRVYIEQGEPIKPGSKRTFTVNAPVDSIEESISLLRLDGPPRKPVQYINVAGIKDLGQIQMSTPATAGNREIEVTLDFSGTELNVSAMFVATRQRVSARFQFSTY